jgi:gamma-glutamylaminecyclotransferase
MKDTSGTKLSKLFVYGTLKKGFGNHRLLEGQKLLGNATICGYEMYSMGNYPAIRQANEGYIHGELYEIEDTLWPRLDRLEGVPYLYTRETDTVWMDGKDETHQADIYVYANPIDGPTMRSGEWT